MTQTKEKPGIETRSTDAPPLEQWHPCAITVALARYFQVAYNELPPTMPFEIQRDGQLFTSRVDRQTKEIVVQIRDLERARVGAKACEDAVLTVRVAPERFATIYI